MISPSVAPNSFTTIPIWTFFSRNNSSTLIACIVSGIKSGEEIISFRSTGFLMEIAWRISLTEIIPMTLSMVFSHTGNLEKGVFRMVSIISSVVCWLSINTISMLEVIRLYAVLSPKRKTSFMISDSFLSITPCSEPWFSRICNSSSVTGGLFPALMLNNRVTSFAERLKNATIGYET